MGTVAGGHRDGDTPLGCQAGMLGWEMGLGCWSGILGWGIRVRPEMGTLGWNIVAQHDVALGWALEW